MVEHQMFNKNLPLESLCLIVDSGELC